MIIVIEDIKFVINSLGFKKMPALVVQRLSNKPVSKHFSSTLVFKVFWIPCPLEQTEYFIKYLLSK